VIETFENACLLYCKEIGVFFHNTQSLSIPSIVGTVFACLNISVLESMTERASGDIFLYKKKSLREFLEES